MKDKYKDDYNFVQNGCQAIRNGKAKEFVKKFYGRYWDYLSQLACKELSPLQAYNQVQDLVNDFVIHLIKNQILCTYRGDASLKTFVWRIFKRFAARWIEEEIIKPPPPITSVMPGGNSEEGPSLVDVVDFLHTEQAKKSGSFDKNGFEPILVKQEKKKPAQNAVAKTLLTLALNSPEDARILILLASGFKREEVAKILNMEYNSLTKRLTRSPYGIYQKFRKLFRKILREDYKVDPDVISFSDISD